MNTHMHTPTPVSIFESKPVDLKIDEVVTDASGHVIPLNFNLIFFLLACYFKGYVCLLDHPRLKTMATPLILWVISICQSLWSHGCNRGLGGDNDMQRMFVVKGFWKFLGARTGGDTHACDHSFVSRFVRSFMPLALNCCIWVHAWQLSAELHASPILPLVLLHFIFKFNLLNLLNRNSKLCFTFIFVFVATITCK